MQVAPKTIILQLAFVFQVACCLSRVCVEPSLDQPPFLPTLLGDSQPDYFLNHRHSPFFEKTLGRPAISL